MGRKKMLYLKYMIPRKKGALIRSAFIIMTLSSLMCAWWLADSTSNALLPPLPMQQLDHLRLNRNLKSYLDSIDVLIEPSSTVCSKNNNIPVLVLVTSSPTRFEQREAIRSTWGKWLPTYFIMGLNTPSIEDMMVDNYVEAKMYSDVIIYNFQDHYQNLTLKTALMLKWTLAHCSTNLMLFKTDDDVLVNPWMLKRVLNETSGKDLVAYHSPQLDVGFSQVWEDMLIVAMPGKRVGDRSTSPVDSNDAVVCYKFTHLGLVFIAAILPSEGFYSLRKMNNCLHRDEYSKWYSPRWLHREDFISEYLSGTGYLINGKHIQKILDAAYEVPIINLEDVYFTYLVSKLKLGLNLTHDHRLSPYKPWLSISCMYAGLASAHSLAPEEMLNIWPNIENLGDGCDHFVNKIWNEWFLY